MPQPSSDVSRRALLVGAAAGTLVGAAAEPSLAGTARGGLVVVVGAGMAGISAADRLRRAGYDVRVLEARQRLGGRIHTWRGWPGVPLDLGASWIHGYAAGNPITPIARRAGVRLVPSSYDSGRVHVNARLEVAGVRPHWARWGRIVEEAKRSSLRRPRDESLRRAVRRRVAELDLTPYERDELAFYLNATYTTEWGAGPATLSAWTVDEGKEYGPTGEDAYFPHGYDRVPTYLARHLKIDYGTTVHRVVRRPHGVRIETSAGPLHARAVVVTVPLGVLKHGGIEFSPGLPAGHERAVHRLGMGVLSKTFLRFEKPFWAPRLDWQEYLGPGHGRWAEWFSMAKSGAPVLVAFHGGRRARELESAEPGDVRNAAMATLRSMFGNDIPAPVSTTTTRWSRDPLAHGSYSTNAVGSTRADRIALGRPVAGRIFFAGEATEPDYSSTVHGAYRTGRRVARDVRAALG